MPYKREYLSQIIARQRRWIAQCGGSKLGYIAHYEANGGSADGYAESLYRADVARLRELMARQAA